MFTVVPDPNVHKCGQNDADAGEGEEGGPHEVGVVHQTVGSLASLDSPHRAMVI